MDIWFAYIIKTLLLPPCSLLLLALSSGISLARGKQKSLYTLLTTLMIWYALSTPLISRALAKSWETYPALSLSTLATSQAQAIVVLGGGINPFAPEYGEAAIASASSLERLHYSAKIAKITKLPILVTGGTPLEVDQPDEASIMAKTLIQDFGVPVRWQESKSRNTAQNARFSYTLLNKHHISKIILVTHALHMPRAFQEFKAAGFSILPAPTSYITDYSKYNILSFLPSASAFFYSTKTIHEYLGYLWIYLKTFNLLQPKTVGADLIRCTHAQA